MEHRNVPLSITRTSFWISQWGIFDDIPFIGADLSNGRFLAELGRRAAWFWKWNPRLEKEFLPLGEVRVLTLAGPCNRDLTRDFGCSRLTLGFGASAARAMKCHTI